MKKKYLLFMLFLLSTAYSQQSSKIKIDSANKNDISVIQSGKDSSQKSDIDIQHSDNNKTKINQTQQDSSKIENKSSGFQKFISNTQNLVALCISILALTGGIWKGIQFFKKRGNKK